MKKLKIIAGVVALFITLPIWFYILYQVLDAIQATELTWFLYWVYVPASILVGMIGKIIGEE